MKYTMTYVVGNFSAVDGGGRLSALLWEWDLCKTGVENQSGQEIV